MAGIGQDITAVDYNNIRSKILGVLGNGVGQSGYGQPLVSSDVNVGNNVTAEQWAELQADIVTCKVHQDGELPSVVSVDTGDVIRYGAGHPVTNYITLANQIVIDKFDLAVGNQLLTSNQATQTNTSQWYSQAQCNFTLTFLNANDARHFFNSGGKIRINSTFTKSVSATNDQQNNAWNALLTSVGQVEIGGAVPLIENIYTLTTSYQTLYQQSSSAPYSANFYRIEALCNCSEADNSTGTATTFDFRITWKDDYVDPGAPPPGDGPVDGTLTIAVDEIKANSRKYQSLTEPGDVFSINSPSYSITSITTA